VKIRKLHSWNHTPKEAVALQNRLAEKVVQEGGPLRVRWVAGADVATSRFSTRAWAGVVVLSYPDLRMVEEQYGSAELTFPYIPGLLAFREIPLLLDLFQRVRHTPDLVLVDGQGVAHPRGLGLASHLGLLLEIPTVGCAKSRLCGYHAAPGRERGSSAPLRDAEKAGGRTIGCVLRTKTGVRPLYVSVGHRITLRSAARWTLTCCRGYRLPEPTRQAHLLVSRLRRESEGSPGCRIRAQ
jgi:deoxyribonuclease V